MISSRFEQKLGGLTLDINHMCQQLNFGLLDKQNPFHGWRHVRANLDHLENGFHVVVFTLLFLTLKVVYDCQIDVNEKTAILEALDDMS